MPIVRMLNLPESVKRGLLHPSVQFAVAFGALFLGVAVSLWSDVIRDSTRMAVEGLVGDAKPGEPLWGVVVFWLCALCWTVLSYLRLIADASDSKQNLRRLEAAVQRAPNPNVVRRYERYILPATEALERWRAEHDASIATEDKASAATAQRIAAQACIQSFLRIIAGLAAEFSFSDEQDSYGSAIMVLVKRPLEEAWGEGLSFGLGATYGIGNIEGVLHSPVELILPNLGWKKPRSVPPISLPVPAPTGSAKALTFPGPPDALLSGRAVLHEQMDQFYTACAHLDERVRQEVKNFYSRRGAGQDVRSQLSVRLGQETDEPVGILIIDANRPCLLGEEDVYYESFQALLAPLSYMLLSPVATFAALTTPDIVESPEPTIHLPSRGSSDALHRTLENDLKAESKYRASRESTIERHGDIVMFGIGKKLALDFRPTHKSRFVRAGVIVPPRPLSEPG